MKTIEISSGWYASKWGLTDFYPESEEKLRSALDSGEDFETEWFGCKKEIRYAQYERCGETFTVRVACHMDDLFEEPDLIYDALWEACHMEKEFPEDIIDSIRDAAIGDCIDDSTVLSKDLPASATFEEIIRVTDELEEEAEAENKRMYNTLIDIVKAHVEYMKENGIEFISDEE